MRELRLRCVIILLMISSCVHAQSLSEIRVTKTYRNKPLHDVILDLKSSYSLNFFYVDQQIDTLVVSAIINNQTLDQSLRIILSKTVLEFYFRNDGGIVVFYSGSKSKKKYSEKNLHTLKGKITDNATGRPLSFVNIYIQNTQQGILSDDNGNFNFNNLTEDIYLVRFSFLGYGTEERSIDLSNDVNINIALKDSPIELEPIEVSPNVYEISLTEESSLTLTEKEILHSPNLIKDISRTLRTIPGVANNEYSAKPRIRGGSSDETVFYLDNFEIMEPYHFEEFGGFFSMINTDYVSNVKVIPGGFKAAYTDKTSGVIDVKTPDNVDKNKAGLSIDLLNSTLLVKQKINNKTDVQFSGRRTYVDFLLDLDKEKNVEIKPLAFDFWSKMNYKINEKNLLSFNILHATDRGGVRVRISNFNWIDLNSKKNNDYAWVNWRNFKSERYQQITVAGYQRLDRKTTFSFNNSINHKNVDSRINNIGIVTHTSYLKVGHRNDVEFGGELKYFSSHLKFTEARFNNFESTRETTKIDSINVNISPITTLGAVFLQNTFSLTENFSAMAAIRLSYFSTMTKPFVAAPRLTLGYKINDKLNVKVGYGTYNQAAYPQQIRIYEGEQVPITHYKQSLHYIGNITYSTKKTNVMLNAYYKDNRKLMDDYQYDVYNRLGGGIAILDKSFTTTSGYSKGLEFILRHMYGHKSSIAVWYAYATNRIKNSTGLETNRDNDRKHTFIINNLLNLKRNWTLSAYSMFFSGEPYTPSDINFVGQNGERNIIFFSLAQKNSKRLPSFYSLDVRIDKSWYYKKWHLNIYLNFINLTGHENVRNYFWGLESGDTPDNYTATKIKSTYIPGFVSPGIGFWF